MQNRAARKQHFSNYDSDADILLERINWKKLDTQRKIQKTVMAHKSLNGLAPDYLSHIFVDCSTIGNYTLRDTEG